MHNERLYRVVPPAGTYIRVNRGTDTFLGYVESNTLFQIGGKVGFHIKIHNHNGHPVKSNLFVSDETWFLISL